MPCIEPYCLVTIPLDELQMCSFHAGSNDPYDDLCRELRETQAEVRSLEEALANVASALSYHDGE